MIAAPTPEEIQTAYEGISADGPGADVTTGIAVACMLSPVIQEATRRKKILIEAVFAEDESQLHGLKGEPAAQFVLQSEIEKGKSNAAAKQALVDSTILSLTIYGINLGMRISKARSDGLRSRAAIEKLLAHIKADQCKPLTDQAQAVALLEWVLGGELAR